MNPRSDMTSDVECDAKIKYPVLKHLLDSVNWLLRSVTNQSD